ncbi:spinster family MFS transporter [Roseateles sp. NT4]|uniref:spinster family MFS transporter n=1 Tax=Roseateles sp. NT4 TaxID=3453715 RepID=UPI003EEBC0DE
MNGSTPAHTLYSEGQRWRLLAVLFLVSMSNYIDRSIISVLLEPIKKEFGASDTQMGLLTGIAFAFFYATLGIPMARWADRGNRRHIVTLSLTVWSVMTALCGAVQSFWQLMLARFGVGMGESGALPPAQSLIVDYFPPERRALALALFTSSSTAGYLVAFAGGAWLVIHHGWRMAFAVVGLPGLALALLTHLMLKEPRELQGYAKPAASGEARFADTVRKLMQKRSYVGLIVGGTLYAFMAFGVVMFFPSYMVRSLGASMTQVGTVYGSVGAAAALLGTLGGGWLADRLGRSNVAWYARLPGLGIVLAGPAYWLGFSLDFHGFLACSFVASVLITAGMPSLFAALHAVCGSSRRAVAVALLMFCMSLLGGGLGPLATGVLSDFYAAAFGADALRMALMTCTSMLVPSAIAFFYAARHLQAEVQA